MPDLDGMSHACLHDTHVGTELRTCNQPGCTCMCHPLPDAVTAAFHGHQSRECGEHRTVGPHRAWCFECTEWCYPNDGCKGCRLMGAPDAARRSETPQDASGSTPDIQSPSEHPPNPSATATAPHRQH